MKTLVLAFVLVTAALPAFAGRCVKPGGATGCHASIQEAVMMSAPGETITVYPGTYLENVAIPPGKDGLTITGLDLARRNTTVVDLEEPNSSVGFIIRSADVTLRYLTLRNGEASAVEVLGDRARIQKLRILSPSGHGVLVASAGTTVSGNEIRAAGGAAVDTAGSFTTVRSNILGPCEGACVQVQPAAMGSVVDFNTMSQSADACLVNRASGVLLQGNRISQCAGDGILSLGDGARIHANTITGVADCIAATAPIGTGVEEGIVAAPEALELVDVRRNTCRQARGYGISVAARNLTILNNVVEGAAADGLALDCLSCSGGLVQFNAVSQSGGADVYADGPGLLVADNRFRFGHWGMDASGTGLRLERNLSESNGSLAGMPGFRLTGTAHDLVANVARGNAGPGFLLPPAASQSSLRLNQAAGNFEDGFSIAGSSLTLQGNTSTGNLGEGFQLGGDGNVLSGNSASRNRADFCDAGATNATLTANTFVVTGTCDVTNVVLAQ